MAFQQSFHRAINGGIYFPARWKDSNAVAQDFLRKDWVRYRLNVNELPRHRATNLLPSAFAGIGRL